GGCCTVMPYFIGDIVELPLTTTQDYSLFQILKDFSNEIWDDQIEAITASHGLISFITHPDYLGERSAQRAYGALLDRLSRLRAEHGCWIPLRVEVASWWRQRSRMQLVHDGVRWEIQGEGRERARIAYARLRGDEVVYRLEAALPSDLKVAAS